MRFTADYDSEEEEFPVNDAAREIKPYVGTNIDYLEASSEDDDQDDAGVSTYHSPGAGREAWVNFISYDN
jgi:hypothetical protein